MADAVSSSFSHNFIDVSGLTFGSLTALHPERKGNHVFWRCACRCGGTPLIRVDRLQSRRPGDCACPRRAHGYARRGQYGPEYRTWMRMNSRCYVVGDNSYDRYGAKGVTVCGEWRRDFLAFLNHIGPKPGPEYTLDRIYGSRGYEPGNVRWATRKEQQNNLSTNRLISCQGRTRTVAQWADEIGLPYNTVHQRIQDGWPPERAFNEPVAHRSKKHQLPL